MRVRRTWTIHDTRAKIDATSTRFALRKCLIRSQSRLDRSQFTFKRSHSHSHSHSHSDRFSLRSIPNIDLSNLINSLATLHLHAEHKRNVNYICSL